MKKRAQVTCYCDAYGRKGVKNSGWFPHRIGSGKCKGSEWAASYELLVHETCETCACYNTGESGARGERSATCDVAEGLESINQCEGFRDHMSTQPDVRLPMSVDDYVVWKYPEEFE